MLEFSDLPYQFFPPKPNRLVIRIGQWANHHLILPGPNHRISELEIDGADRVRGRIASGASLLFLPNHSTHSDPQIMTEVQRRLGISASFMAAYDVFLRGKVGAWMMQRCGSFSVDREGSDRRSMSTAIDVLKKRKSLTIFPEGNVYFTADRVTPFLEGAAFIGVKAQKALGESRPVFVIPVAIKATHLIDQRAAVLGRLSRAAQIVGSNLDRSAEPIAELRRIGQLALQKHLLSNGFETVSDDLPIYGQVLRAAGTIADSLEADLELEAKPGFELADRLRKIRSKIHQIRIDDDSNIEAQTATGWADRAILALRLLGYTRKYVAESPTLDRFAETVEKLLEDLESKAPKPYGKRRAIIRLCEPIDLREHSGRGAVSEVTARVESAVQNALDEINASNTAPGSRRFSDSAQTG